MSISQEQIKNIVTKLSKLHMTNPKLESDVLGIIEHMELLNELDTTGVIPTVSVSHTHYKSLRGDIESMPLPPKTLLQCSPQPLIAQQIALSNIMH